MSEAYIKENHLETDLRQFQFDDELPVVAAYARCAVVSEGTDNHSIDAQLESIRRMCNEKFGENAFHLIAIADDGYSGNLPLKKPRLRKGKYRPGLTLVTKLIENRLIKYLAVHRIDRIARDPLIWLQFHEDYLKGKNG